MNRPPVFPMNYIKTLVNYLLRLTEAISISGEMIIGIGDQMISNKEQEGI